MVTTSTLESIAETLRNAYQTKVACAPIREIIGTDDIDAAYQIQNINNQLLIDQGARVVGRKIGLTSKAVQKQLGVDRPDYGALLNTMEILNGDEVPWNEVMQPKAEAEIALVLGKDILDPTLSVADLLGAIEYALPSIEIVGSRIENWNIRFTDTVADNASASHFVVGHQPISLKKFDIVNCKMNMQKNGTIVSKGRGSACLGSPINAAMWLAKTMIAHKTPLRAGDVILTGALGPMANVEPGDHVSATFKGLGNVSVYFGK